MQYLYLRFIRNASFLPFKNFRLFETLIFLWFCRLENMLCGSKLRHMQNIEDVKFCDSLLSQAESSEMYLILKSEHNTKIMTTIQNHDHY